MRNESCDEVFFFFCLFPSYLFFFFPSSEYAFDRLLTYQSTIFSRTHFLSLLRKVDSFLTSASYSSVHLGRTTLKRRNYIILDDLVWK